MSEPDREVVELLRDDPDLLAIADAIAATQPRGRALLAWRLLAVAAVVAAVVVLAVFGPWHGHGNGLVGRALAAVGAGPVLHAVITSDVPNETIVNLSTGDEQPVDQKLEYWYDAGRGLLRAASTLNGGIVFDALVPRYGGEPQLDPALTAVVSRYREALKSGEARDVGRGTVDGRPVIWLRFDYRQFGERVGIDADTYRPVVIEPLDRRGKPTKPTWRVASIATGPYRSRDFKTNGAVGRVSIEGRFRMIGRRAAAQLLGWTPFWLGSSFRGIPLLSTQLESMVRTQPPPRRTALGVMFSYGGVTDRIQITEATEFERLEWFEPGPGPRPGTAWLRRLHSGGPIRRTCQALTRMSGIWVTVEGWNESSARCIDAARALVRVPK